LTPLIFSTKVAPRLPVTSPNKAKAEVLMLLAAVNLPLVSTVKVGIVVVEP